MKKILITLIIAFSLCTPAFVSAQEAPAEDAAIPVYFFSDEEENILGITPISEELFLWFYPLTEEEAQIAQEVGADVVRVNFTGHEYDDGTGLYYMNARYQDPEIGRFISEDPVFQAIGTGNMKQKYGKELSQILVEPQSMNSYSYVKNNPLNYVDPNGESEWWAWATNPLGTLRQVAFWKGVASGFVRGYKNWSVSAGFLEHSLKLNPRDLKINERNDSYGVIDKIKGSSEYLERVNYEINKSNNAEENTLDSGKVGITFKNGDLLGSIHKADINIKGNRDENGVWNLNTTIGDTYDFKYGVKDYLDKPELQAGANAARASSDKGVISEYKVNINFRDKR